MFSVHIHPTGCCHGHCYGNKKCSLLLHRTGSDNVKQQQITQAFNSVMPDLSINKETKFQVNLQMSMTMGKKIAANFTAVRKET